MKHVTTIVELFFLSSWAVPLTRMPAHFESCHQYLRYGRHNEPSFEYTVEADLERNKPSRKKGICHHGSLFPSLSACCFARGLCTGIRTLAFEATSRSKSRGVLSRYSALASCPKVRPLFPDTFCIIIIIITLRGIVVLVFTKSDE